MNSSGTAVGFYTDAGGYQDAALFNGARSQLGANGVATGINDSGVAVGYSYTGGATTVTQWSNGQATSLGITGAGMAIDNSGEIAGGYQVSPTQLHAFTQQNGKLTDLGTLGGTWSSAYAINNSGAVAGTSTLSNGRSAAFLYSNGSMQSLGTLGGSNSYGMAISQNGLVAGTSQNSAGYLRAFLWNGGILQNLGTLGGSISDATGVNSAGWVVGNSTTAGNLSTGGFLWMDGSMLDLNNLLPLGSGWTITGAYAVNDSDEILASAVDNGKNFAVELTPGALFAASREPAAIPEPEAIALTAVGVLLVGFIHKRRKRQSS